MTGARRRGLLAVAGRTAALAIGIAGLAIASPAVATAQEDVEEKLNEVRKGLEESEARAEERAARMESLMGDIGSLDARLLRSGRKRAALAAEERELGAEYETHLQRLESLEGQFATSRALLIKRLSSIYKRGRLGSTRVLAVATSTEPMRMARYLVAVSSADRGAFSDYDTVRAKHRLAITELDEKKARIASQRTALREEVARYESARVEKTELVASIEKDLDADRLKRERLEANEEQLRKILAAAPSPEPSEPKKDESRTRPTFRYTPRSDEATFASRRGKLAAPVRGRIVSRFGEKQETGPSLRGLLVRAESDYQVVAVASGEVVFAGPFPGLGNTLIINHGDRYHSVYAHLGVIQHEVGGRVRDNEVIGTLASAEPLLHFELRAEGKPLDPAAWFRDGYAAFRP